MGGCGGGKEKSIEEGGDEKKTFVCETKDGE